ncbi:hypothetical protein [Luteimonas sp. FCS-9]|uniref:hypothetical protein n=1 Tax=Luteimonas sp. FCS-9 TaxID=1547516 RepID=UPI00063EBAF9|nr:hypothetical protein [Luteimonas sp. FCS-9]KLJ01028.1 hypothetical protein WQ56_07270 [Luteimonas sp. FCS-9]
MQTRRTSQWTVSGGIELALVALLSLALVLGVAPRADGPATDDTIAAGLAAPHDAPYDHLQPVEAKFRRPLPLHAYAPPRLPAPDPDRPQAWAVASVRLAPRADAAPAPGHRPPLDAAATPHALRPDLTLPPGQAPPLA